MYGLGKVHKCIIDNCQPFRPILPVINTPTCKLKKSLNSLTSNEYTVKNSFAFLEEIFEQDPEFFIGSLDIDLFLLTSHLKKLLTFALIHFLKMQTKIEGLSKIKFKELFSLAAKESYFIFNEERYKQVDEVALVSTLGPTLADDFLVYFQKN